jgi:hypothetical protein
MYWGPVYCVEKQKVHNGYGENRIVATTAVYILSTGFYSAAIFFVKR